MYLDMSGKNMSVWSILTVLTDGGKVGDADRVVFFYCAEDLSLVVSIICMFLSMVTALTSS